MSTPLPVIVSAKGAASFTPAPINPGWILAGTPQARAAELSHSRDGDAFTCLWECTAGTFEWHFDCDETVHVLDGAVRIVWGGTTFDLMPGDTAYFPKGSITTWQVEHHVRKIAFLRLPPPRLVSLPLRAWRKIKRMAGGGKPGAALHAGETQTA